MKPAELLLYRPIVGADAEKFVASIAAAGDAPIHLRINSPGGDVFAGNAIYNALRAHAPGVTVTVDGIAASMASIIMLAGQTIRIAENAMVMIHNPSSNGGGTAESLRREAELLDQICASMLDAYAGRIGSRSSRAKIQKMLDAETWLTASKAVELGLADEIIAPEVRAAATLAATFLSQFRNSPKAMPKAEITDEQFADLLARVEALEAKAAPEPAAPDARLEAALKQPEVAAEIERRATAKSREIAASFGINPPIAKPGPNATEPAKPVAKGLKAAIAAHKAKK